ncbi:MAG: SPOR domain-containing protein [Hyphomicrobiales bacterium]|nr:MAG: SPOR domain-containing protein [Hyphomicrobiales bacterium]
MRVLTWKNAARRLAIAGLAAGFALLAGATANAQQLDEGWWIVLGSFPTEPWERQASDLETMHLKARPCRLEPFNDFSAKFEGFRPGYNVFVVGAYASKGEAQNKLLMVRSCFADAYVKYGRYLGE